MVALMAMFVAAAVSASPFLVVTGANTPEAVKVALDAAAPLPGGVGITAAGGVAAFTESGTLLEFRDTDLAAIWPADEAAPYAWYVTPEDDAGLFSVSYGASVSVVPAEIAQRLLIDGVLHRIGSVQVPGDRPASILRVGGFRRDPVIDASGRTVEIPTAGKTRVARSRHITLPDPDNPILGLETGRDLDDRIIVWTGPGPRNGWRNLTLSTLLDGALDESPDSATRYVAIRAEASGTAAATFTVAEIEAGASITGLDAGVAFPSITVPAGEFVRLAVVVPTGDAFTYFSHAQFNGGGFPANARSLYFADSPTDTITLTSGADVDVYVAHLLYTALTFGTGWHAYFDRDSVNP